MTQSWTGGYVADVAYTEGFYVQQSPVRMALACLLGNVAIDLAEPDDEACYLELGCGCGIGALLIAASNPGWNVTAIDYNPAHIAIGDGIARAARIGNIRFLEADLSQLAGSAVANSIPAADFVSMHGLWSWVSRDVRAGIVRLLAAKTRPGGAVHVSYNAMPAWQGAIGMQRLIYEAGIRSGGRSDHQAEAGLALAREVKEAGGKYLTESSLSRDVIDNIHGMSKEYLSHEYMSAHWSPAFHADVAAAMAEAKLDWVASANPLENFPELMLSVEQRALFERYSDPIMRELVKDTCLPRQLRHDVYVRGARRMRNTERDAAIAHLTVAPVIRSRRAADYVDRTGGHRRDERPPEGLDGCGDARPGEDRRSAGARPPTQQLAGAGERAGRHTPMPGRDATGERAARQRQSTQPCPGRAHKISGRRQERGRAGMLAAGHRADGVFPAAVHRRPPAQWRARGQGRGLG